MRSGRLTVWFLVLAVAAMACFPAVAAAATLRVHVINYPVAVTLLPAGDEEGHALVLVRREGEAVLDSEEKARYSTVFSVDIRRAKGGSSQGYTRFDFADGSRIVISWTAAVGIGDDGLSRTTGQGRVVAGAGRFADIDGTCAFTAKEEKSGAIVADAELSYTLP